MSALLLCLLAAPGDDAFAAYLKKAVERIEKKFMDGAKTREEWEEKRPRLMEEYLDMLGILSRKKTPLKAMVTGTVKRAPVVIEKLHFQSLPGLYVTGNLYRPAEAKGRLPAILYVCGHSGKGRDGNKTAFQDHGMWFARNGYVCLVIDTLQLGEVKGVHHGTYNLGKWHWHSRGYTPAGVEAWNGIRAIDYLQSRKDVDGEKIGVTGISGGGAVTLWIAAADDRVKVAVPVSGMSDLRSYVIDKVINNHCDCMFMANFYGWEWTTIAAMVAPRPMLFANSDNDPIFPMDGNRRISAKLRKCYKMLGKPDLFDDHVSKGGHDYRPDLRLAVFRFLDKHLKGEKRKIEDAADEPLPGKELRVFPTEADLPKDSINHKIDETFIPIAKPGELKEEELENAKKNAWFAPLASAFNVAAADEFRRGKDDRREVEIAGGDKKRGLLWVSLDDPAKVEKAAREAAKLARAGTLVLVAPRGSGTTAFTRKSPPNTVERSLFLLGQTLDQGRLFDILKERNRAREAHPGIEEWAVGGEGRAGILAAYAVLHPEQKDEVILGRPPATHLDGPQFPSILRVTDIPEALGALAPRKLTLVGAKDKAFDRTAKLYELEGAKDKFIRK
ncbi:MAG: prolyl oligopeptidase family serine peptidase [Gemmataceae bacterium]|nr:prolyl oligopeptidase family serine peptidase [Gemmataceae bacterium]